MPKTRGQIIAELFLALGTKQFQNSEGQSHTERITVDLENPLGSNKQLELIVLISALSSARPTKFIGHFYPE